MAKLVDVVLHAPDRSGFAHQIGAHFDRNDLVGAALRAMCDDRSVKVYRPSPPIESNVPSEPHMPTLAVAIK